MYLAYDAFSPPVPLSLPACGAGEDLATQLGHHSVHTEVTRGMAVSRDPGERNQNGPRHNGRIQLRVKLPCGLGLLQNPGNEPLSAIEDLGDLAGIAVFRFEQDPLQEQAHLWFRLHEESVLVEQQLDSAHGIRLPLQGAANHLLPVMPDLVEDGFEEGILAVKMPINGPVVAKNSIGHKERIIHASVEGPKDLLNGRPLHI